MILISFLDSLPYEIVNLKFLVQFLNCMNSYYQKDDREHEILVAALSKKCQKGSGTNFQYCNNG